VFFYAFEIGFVNQEKTMWNAQNPPFQLAICPPILFFTILFLAIIVAFTTQKTDRKGKIHCYSMIEGIDTHTPQIRGFPALVMRN
jgi:hypothetical protein